VANQNGEGTLTGIDLPNEIQGRVDSLTVRQKLHAANPKGFPITPTWNSGDNIEMAFGQGGTVVTPLEQAVTYATFANGGTRYQPQVASAIVDPTTGKVVKQFNPVVTGHVSLPPSVYGPILTGLEGVITSGTASADFTGFPSNFVLAGKTGTATVRGLKGAASEPTSWFVAFGPQPKPTYLVLAVIDEGGYGANAAAPLVRNVFNYLLTNQINPVKYPKGTGPPSSTAPASNAPASTPTTTSTTTAPATSTPATASPGTTSTVPASSTTTSSG
jgi:penicillin-binding protein 2